MRAWFFKMRISSALDSGKPLPESVRRQLANSPELRRFERSITAVDRALKTARPLASAHPSLHHSIMRSVEAAPISAPAPWYAGLARFMAPSLAAATALMLLWSWHHPNPPRTSISAPQSLSAASDALDLSSAVTHHLPANVLAPLSDELGRLNLDAEAAARFLLSSLPGSVFAENPQAVGVPGARSEPN